MTIKEFKGILQPNIPYKIWYPDKEDISKLPNDHKYVNILKTNEFDNISIHSLITVFDGLIIIPNKQ